MKAILMSVKPKWFEMIFSGKKTIEVRKTAPKEPPFKVYVYCTSIKNMNLSDYVEMHAKTDGKIDDWSGKVIGEFVCERVRAYIPFGLRGFELFPEWLEQICLSKEQLDKYGGLKTLYGWHISDLKIYDKPRELGEFKTPDKPYHEIIERDGSLMLMDGYESGKPLKRAPQSWQYVEEI